MPSPAAVWDAFVAGVRDGDLIAAAVRTLIRLLFSFAVAVSIGVALGLGLALNEFARAIDPALIVALADHAVRRVGAARRACGSA